MQSLSKTIAQLAAARANMPGGIDAGDRLADLLLPGANPGALRARTYVPPGLEPDAPLVVVLHGCTQDAAGYDRGAGWSTLADRAGFALLFPEQTRANNPNLCFNWFVPGDIGRIGGEAESIADMVETMLAAHDLDRGRVFVTGLSAGGAMAAVMLATYPELFQGGAVIGGLPYGCASTIPEALAQMRERHGGGEDALATAVRRAANGYEGPWPTLSLWHGSADATVAVSNMGRLGRQWRHLHGIEDAAPDIVTRSGWEHSVWRGEAGRSLVEEWRIAGMGHGVPIAPNGPDRLGASGPYMLDVGLSSTALIAGSWGLVAHVEAAADQDAATTALPPRVVQQRIKQEPADTTKGSTSAGIPDSIQHTIERALRSAGLMR